MQKRKKTKKEKIVTHLKKLELAKSSNGKKYNYVAICVLLSLIIISIYSIYVGNHTIIEFGILMKYSLILGIVVFLALCISPLSQFVFWKEIQLVIFQLLVVCCIVGIVILYSNYISFNPIYNKKTLKLEDKHEFEDRRGSKRPIATITYNGSSKDIWFSVYETPQFYLADSLSIEIRKGNLGFGVFRNYEFVNNEN